QCLLLTNPVDGVVGHVLGEVVALLGRPVGLHRSGVAVDRRGVLFRLSADEAVEVLKPTASGRPGVERAERAGFPYRYLMTLAELGRGVPVQIEGLRQRGASVRAGS